MRYLLIAPNGKVVDGFKSYDELIKYVEQKEIDLIEYDAVKAFYCRVCREWYPYYHKAKNSAMCVHCREKIY